MHLTKPMHLMDDIWYFFLACPASFGHRSGPLISLTMMVFLVSPIQRAHYCRRN